MDKDYKNITTEQLLQDDYFMSSIVNPTEESEIFWNCQLADGNIDNVVFTEARDILLSLGTSSRSSDALDGRISALWGRIEGSINSSVSSKKVPKSKRSRILPLTILASAACIAAAIILRPATDSGDGLTTVNGADVRVLANTGDADYIKLVLGEKVVEMTGDEAHLDYRDGSLKINEKQIADNVVEGGMLNMLAVPYGKRSMIVLADGSRLWINAGTKVIYPQEFGPDRREVYLDGEIYGDIVHDPDWPFVIKTKRAAVEVLGTTLNVNAYEKENEFAVVLVTGKVTVSGGKGPGSELHPGQMYFSQGNEHYVTTVNVSEYTSWKDGNYKFRNEKISTIVNRLSKYYNVKIVADPATAGLTCSGELILNDELTRVLDVICNTAQILYSWDETNKTYMLHR